MVLLSSQSSQGSPLSPEKSPSAPSGLPGPCWSRYTTSLSSHPSWVLPSQSSTCTSSNEPQGLCTSCSFFLKYSRVYFSLASFLLCSYVPSQHNLP